MNLHSNMVRFIIRESIGRLYALFIIYIPIWLDLLFTMTGDCKDYLYIFTFQYG